MSRITNTQLLARMDARDATVDARLTGLVESIANLTQAIALGREAQFSTPAPVVERATAAVGTPQGKTMGFPSYASGANAVANGWDPELVLVPAGKFGKGGTQTFTQATAKREANDAKRVTYLAERDAKASKPASVVELAVASLPKVEADPFFALGRKQLDVLVASGTKAERAGAQAEIDRRQAKRTSK